MATRMNGSLRVCLAGAAIGGLVAFAPVPAARAQWLPPWGGAPPGEIERSLEAQGYGLIAPLMRRPGVYLADVSAGPAGYQRLVVDARSGQILERFAATGRMWRPTLAARNEEFGEPQPGDVGPPLNPSFSGRPAAAAPSGKSAYGGPANLYIPAALSPYGQGSAAWNEGQSKGHFDRTQGAGHQSRVRPAFAASRATRSGEAGRIGLASVRAGEGA